MPIKKTTLLIVMCFLLAGADGGCPLAPQDQQDAETSRSGINIGATWEVTYEDTLGVLLRDGGASGSARTDILRPVDLLGSVIDVEAFCFRSDIVCPQNVLPVETAIEHADATRVQISFMRRGPLARVNATRIGGRLDGRELTVPLGLPADLCGLSNASAILATAYVDDEDGSEKRAATMRGRVTVGYAGTCFALGGGAVSPTALVELSADFTARRLSEQ